MRFTTPIVFFLIYIFGFIILATVGIVVFLPWDEDTFKNLFACLACEYISISAKSIFAFWPASVSEKEEIDKQNKVFIEFISALFKGGFLIQCPDTVPYLRSYFTICFLWDFLTSIVNMVFAAKSRDQFDKSKFCIISGVTPGVVCSACTSQPFVKVL